MKQAFKKLYADGKSAGEIFYGDTKTALKTVAADIKDGWKFIDRGTQSETLNGHLQGVVAREEYKSLTEKQKRDYIFEKVLTFWKYADGFTMINFFNGRTLEDDVSVDVSSP